jgi:hypothetical protein
MTIATFARQLFYANIHCELALTLYLGTFIATDIGFGCIRFHKSKVFQYSLESFKIHPIRMELSIQIFSQSLQVDDVFHFNYLINPIPLDFFHLL